MAQYDAVLLRTLGLGDDQTFAPTLFPAFGYPSPGFELGPGHYSIALGWKMGFRGPLRSA